jgi:hypothetical protein
MRRALIAVLTAALVVQAGPAFAYRDVGTDPEDSGGGFLDFRRSVRATRTGHEGRRWLSIRFVSYGEYEFIWRVRVSLDSRGGPRSDYKMVLWDFDNSGRGCAVHPRPGRPGERVSGTYGVGGLQHGARCRVPLGAVHASKRIRWRLVSIDENRTRPRIVDHAPDGGAFYG